VSDRIPPDALDDARAQPVWSREKICGLVTPHGRHSPRLDWGRYPLRRVSACIGLYFSVRADADLSALASTIRTLVPQLDRQGMVENVAPMSHLLSNWFPVTLRFD
jgi:hypothetical protein